MSDPTYDPERDRIMRERLEQATKEFSERVVDLKEVRAERRKAEQPPDELPNAVLFEDFLYCSPENKYIFTPNGSLWVDAAVNKRLPWIGGVKPSTIIARNNAVEQMTWSPGEPPLIKHKVIRETGIVKKPNATMYNTYVAPNFLRGDAKRADFWLDHVRYIYPDEAEHIIKWLAHRSQYPEVKINHALVLGGTFGIGKDALLEPMYLAVGESNVERISPTNLLDPFNGYLKSVVLVINEGRDLGEQNRPALYEKLKAIIAAPPDFSRINQKNRQEFYIANLTGVIITTNHKTRGIYIAPDDRRHFIAWSSRQIEDYQPSHAEYFNRYWNAFDDGGREACATYLHQLNVSDFDPKASPPKTPAFFEMVTANIATEIGELGTALARVGNPSVVTLGDLKSQFRDDQTMLDFLTSPRNTRMWPTWFEQNDYGVVTNHRNKQGYWNFEGKRVMAFGRKDLSDKELQMLCHLREKDVLQRSH